MRYQLANAGGTTPIELALAKSYLKVPTNDDDTIITLLINQAINYVEAQIGRELRTNSWIAFFDSFDDDLVLRKNIVEEITELRYVYEGSSVVLDPSYYVLVRDALHARVELASGYSWPTTDTGREKVAIYFQTRATNKIDQVRLCMLQHIAYLYENRGDDRGANDVEWRQFYQTVAVPNFPF